jgi:CRP-like cAMP-binding protein
MVIESLQHEELFGMLTPKEVERLSNASGVMKLKKGERVYAEGTPASHFFVLLKGSVELKRPTKGHISLLVDEVREKGVFGVSSLMEGDRYLLNAECVEDCEVLKVESQVLRRLLEENPAMGYALQKKVSQVFFNRYVGAMERLRGVLQAVAMSRP